MHNAYAQIDFKIFRIGFYKGFWKIQDIWCPKMELNQRHSDFQSLALPTELFGLHIYEFLIDRLNYVKKSMFKF